MMRVTSDEFAAQISHSVDVVIEVRESPLVTRQGGKGNIVVLSEEEFAGWQETVHLLSSPVNAARLFAGIRKAEAGDVAEHALVLPPAS